MSLADLPPSDTTRWVASRKSAVVKAVSFGLITKAEAIKRYALSSEEFECWFMALKSHGESALKATQIKKYRQL